MHSMYTPLETILLAVGPNDEHRLDDLSEAVLQVAVPTDATVVLTHVFTPDQFQSVAEELGYPDITVNEVNTILERHESVRHFKDVFDEYGVDYEVRGIVDDISKGIIRLAEEVDTDRIVVSGRTRSPVGKAVFGSTAQNVMMNSSCPVTFVKGNQNSE